MMYISSVRQNGTLKDFLNKLFIVSFQNSGAYPKTSDPMVVEKSLVQNQIGEFVLGIIA